MKILAAVAAMIFFTVGATAETTNDLSDAEIQGRNLAQQLCDQWPTTNFIQTGILNIRDAKGTSTNIPVSFTTLATSCVWKTAYIKGRDWWIIIHQNGQANRYIFLERNLDEEPWPSENFVHLDENRIMTPFANSDFWIADLGLEFFHWPEQKILPKTTNLVRGRDYTLLESTNPNLSTNGYSRVLSWIDKETGGILEAEAYDFNGKLFKEFAPKSFKKVNGQWQLQEMEIRNVQTGSRTRIEFDLNKQ